MIRCQFTSRISSTVLQSVAYFVWDQHIVNLVVDIYILLITSDGASPGSDVMWQYSIRKYLQIIVFALTCCGEYLNANESRFSFFGKVDLEGIL